MKRIFRCATVSLVITNSVLGLTACGGGGSEGAPAVAGAPAPAPAPPPSPPPTAPVTTHSATVSWAVPLLNTDGTSLTDISGYRVYYGTSADELSQSILIPGSGITSHVLSGLAPGTYYIAVATLNSTGAASDLSTLASTTVP
ncbi:MAG TPA: fibronectin type III domain-containing protein [Burkholderiaceae bacterium]|nr:fibronectin type III domain-containing protein [Burkholderiaceae bacterium]